MRLHQEVEKDYTSKYKQYLTEELGEEEAVSNQALVGQVITETEVFQELKQYRLLKSKEEHIKPYFIFNNKQLEEVILKMPRTLEELGLIYGFGEVKVNKYGDDILQILQKDINKAIYIDIRIL